MSETVKDLISAIATGNAIETENAFSAAMAEKLSVALDNKRIEVAQNMFKTPEAATEE
jgi:hypothetical protein